MKKKPILLIAADLQDLAEKYGKSFINNLELLFDARTHLICDETDCLVEFASNSSAIIYFEKFPADYKHVCRVAASQWNAPMVIGVEENDGQVRIWHGDKAMAWRPAEKILSGIESAIQAENFSEPRTTTVAIVGACILAVALILHISLDKPQHWLIQPDETTNTTYDASPSISPRPST